MTKTKRNRGNNVFCQTDFGEKVGSIFTFTLEVYGRNCSTQANVFGMFALDEEQQLETNERKRSLLNTEEDSHCIEQPLRKRRYSSALECLKTLDKSMVIKLTRIDLENCAYRVNAGDLTLLENKKLFVKTRGVKNGSDSGDQCKSSIKKDHSAKNVKGKRQSQSESVNVVKRNQTKTKEFGSEELESPLVCKESASMLRMLKYQVASSKDIEEIKKGNDGLVTVGRCTYRSLSQDVEPLVLVERCSSVQPSAKQRKKSDKLMEKKVKESNAGTGTVKRGRLRKLSPVQKTSSIHSPKKLARPIKIVEHSDSESSDGDDKTLRSRSQRISQVMDSSEKNKTTRSSARREKETDRLVLLKVIKSECSRDRRDSDVIGSPVEAKKKGVSQVTKKEEGKLKKTNTPPPSQPSTSRSLRKRGASPYSEPTGKRMKPETKDSMHSAREKQSKMKETIKGSSKYSDIEELKKLVIPMVRLTDSDIERLSKKSNVLETESSNSISTHKDKRSESTTNGSTKKLDSLLNVSCNAEEEEVAESAEETNASIDVNGSKHVSSGDDGLYHNETTEIDPLDISNRTETNAHSAEGCPDNRSTAEKDENEESTNKQEKEVAAESNPSLNKSVPETRNGENALNSEGEIVRSESEVTENIEVTASSSSGTLSGHVDIGCETAGNSESANAEISVDVSVDKRLEENKEHTESNSKQSENYVCGTTTENLVDANIENTENKDEESYNNGRGTTESNCAPTAKTSVDLKTKNIGSNGNAEIHKEQVINVECETTEIKVGTPTESQADVSLGSNLEANSKRSENVGTTKNDSGTTSPVRGGKAKKMESTLSSGESCMENSVSNGNDLEIGERVVTVDAADFGSDSDKIPPSFFVGSGDNDVLGRLNELIGECTPENEADGDVDLEPMNEDFH